MKKAGFLMTIFDVNMIMELLGNWFWDNDARSETHQQIDSSRHRAAPAFQSCVGASWRDLKHKWIYFYGIYTLVQ